MSVQSILIRVQKVIIIENESVTNECVFKVSKFADLLFTEVNKEQASGVTVTVQFLQQQ